MSKKRVIQRNKKNIAAPAVVTQPPPHSPFVLTIAYDPASEVVNYNTTRQGDGVIYAEDQIKALRTTYEMFVGRLAIEVNKAEEAQRQEPKG